jgi:hypothetical protein
VHNPSEFYWNLIKDNLSKSDAIPHTNSNNILKRKVKESFKSLLNLGSRKSSPQQNEDVEEVIWWNSIMNIIVDEIKPNCYVEIGIYISQTFNIISPKCKVAVGVDIENTAKQFIKDPKAIFINGTSSDALALLKEKNQLIDLVFIDGNHDKTFVIEDFINMEKLLSNNGLILMHDTWPGTKEQTDEKYCHNAYLAVAELRKLFPQFSFITIPIHPGLTIAQRNTAIPTWAFG